MYVHARLPTGRSYVHADVIPIRQMAPLYVALRLIEQPKHGALLIGGMEKIATWRFGMTSMWPRHKALLSGRT